jgi:hypothetical protein
MALHEIPDDGAPHAPDTSCGCGPQRVEGLRPDGTRGVTYAHVDQGDQLVDAQEGEPVARSPLA